jgi:hypothetical protein
VNGFVLPNTYDDPSDFDEFGVSGSVTLLICSEFPKPPVVVGAGNCAVNWASMPKAPVHEYCDLSPGERYVDPSPPHDFVINAVAKTSSEQDSSERQFRRGVPASLTFHPQLDFRA